jgi:hypothetical protein
MPHWIARTIYGNEMRYEMTKIPDGYVKGVEDRSEAFFQMLEGEDDLGMVIRAHIHIEHELREYILAAAPRPEELKFSDYDYATTLRLALMLGLDPSLKPGLAALGTLRNKFAHRLEMKLTIQEAKQIYSALSQEYKADARKAYATTRTKPAYSALPKDMLKTKPKDLIALCVLMLRGGVLLEHITLRHAAIVRSS